MKQDLVIVVSKYKLWICIIYVMLLSIIFPLAYADEIGGVIDPYSSLLSILFFSDLFYLEILEKRYEVIKLKSKDVLIGLVKRRFFIAWLFVELLALVQYSNYFNCNRSKYRIFRIFNCSISEYYKENWYWRRNSCTYLVLIKFNYWNEYF